MALLHGTVAWHCCMALDHKAVYNNPAPHKMQLPPTPKACRTPAATHVEGRTMLSLLVNSHAVGAILWPFVWAASRMVECVTGLAGSVTRTHTRKALSTQSVAPTAPLL